MVKARDKWRALVNAIMNLRFYKMPRNFRVAIEPMGSRVVLSSIELV
jgi:hypothetical protein